MDPGLIVGLLLAIGAIVGSMVMDGSSLGALISPSSAVLVVVGTIGVTIASYRMADAIRAPKALLVGLKGQGPDPDTVVSTLMDLADVARRKGLLAMEEMLEEIDNEFLRNAIQSVIDGLDAEAVSDVLNTEIDSVHERHNVVVSFYRSLGGFAPTMGMVGTVIGLVNMLGNLSDPGQLGSGMALALLTTLYGVLLANIVFAPIASRLTRLHETELAAMEMARDGALAIQAGVSPRLLVERLESYLAPSQRVGYRERMDRAEQQQQGSQETSEVAA